MPPKIGFFGWTASLWKILTMVNLSKCGLIVTDWCYMWKKSGESVDLLLLHCEMASVLWVEILRTSMSDA